ncbi:MAG: CHAT domain-containing protein, partial [Bacteroidales bacterium]|nr:CHAT domain-containing protein [Bacteroidales bacterium]
MFILLPTEERRTTLMRLKRGFIGLLLLVSAVLSGLPCGAYDGGSAVTVDDPRTIREGRLRELTDSLSAHLETRFLSQNPEKLAGEMEVLLTNDRVMDTLLLSDAYYFLGVHHYQSNRFTRAQDCFTISIRHRERLALADRRYANGLSNLAVSLLRSGDYRQARGYGLKALEAKRAVSGTDSSILVVNYVNLAGIFLELNDTGHAVEMAEAGLKIAAEYPHSVALKYVGDLYQVIGLSLYRGLEYNKSLVYCREALRIYEKVPEASVDSRILMHNTVAQVYRRLDQPGEAEEYFRKGLAITDEHGAHDKSLLSINFSGFLARSGRIEEAEEVLAEGLERVRSIYGPESREYYMMLISVAGFVNENLGDNELSLSLYNECFSYVQENPWDISMKKYLVSMYAEALTDAGKYYEVLRITDEMVITEEKALSGNQTDGLLNGISEDDLNILEVRYNAFNALAREGNNTDFLRQAAATGRIMTSLYDHQRLEMSEEESRTRFSSHSREIYTGIIDNYAKLYEADQDAESLRRVFEFTERSKVAGFLASIRELNAARFSLPEELTQLDSEIRGEIGFYKELIANEKLKAVPDSQKLATWENVRFRLLRSRDSLVRIFEEQYPSYYNLKFRTEVTPLEDVRRVIGRGSNLLSYVLTDDRLYIFVSNSSRSEVITQEIDTLFFVSLKRFREMLSSPPARSGSRAPFNEYMDLAYNLYRVLLKPAEPYLRGDKIVISPDNILSYLPFETLVTDEFRSPGLLYREAPFALKKYRFSYIYSVTLSSETMHRSRSINNRLLAFAPTYEGMELDDSLLISWPSLRGEIRELPFAILEVEDAVDQCGGTAFIGEGATEEAFKREANKYKIIHLAMHTLVDDTRPAFSRMLFTGGGESKDDGMLNTYEVYTLPLQAMMVVLSSCNTGSGMLVNGEGILSLARGFLYAGSRSAVMSMWAVDDVSASSVIHSFYKNMRGGQTKSSALRNARLKFLRTASQGQSHPYYWSALVIYGDDTPLWYDRIKLYTGLLIFLLAATILVAIVYRC